MATIKILKLVWPLALGMVNNAVMQFCDRAFLSHWSMEALEAVLPAGMLMWIFAGFFQSAIGYSSVFVGQFHGAKEPAKCTESYRAATLIAAASGVASLPILPLGEWVLSLFAPSPQVLDCEIAYFGATMSGAFFLYAQIAAAAYFTGRGRTRTVFWVNLAGNLLNIALDPVFIFTLDLGIAGAAAATVLSMALQAATLAFAAERAIRRERDAAPARPFPLRERLSLAARMLRFGVPSGLYTVLNTLSFTIFVFITGGVGEMELAVSNACFTVNYLLFAPIEGFAIGASTLVAQAKGRGDVAAAARDARRVLLLGTGFAAAASALAVAFCHPILSLFAARAGSAAAEFHSLGFTLFLLMAAWQVFDSADVILSGALRGGGDTHFVMWWMLLNAFVLWLPAVWVLSRVNNTMPALWSSMVAYVAVICAGTIARWRGGKWKSIKVA